MQSYNTLGRVRLGSQLRMLADLVTSDAARIYRHFDLNLDPKWFPVFYVLASEPDSTVTSIASTIGHSHVSVSKIVAEMEKAALTVSRKCPADSRRTLINLSAAGKELVPTLEMQCDVVDRALDELATETGVDLWKALEETRKGLIRVPLSERVRTVEQRSILQIVDYEGRFASAFKALNVEWITAHWELEEADLRALDNPEAYVIDRGGAILIALQDGSPVGTVALIPHDEGTLELAKMAVSPTVQGRGIGYALGQAALKRAIQLGAQRVYLESNSMLAPAVSLYRKLGFGELSSAASPSPYARCDVRMELQLRSSPT